MEPSVYRGVILNDPSRDCVVYSWPHVASDEQTSMTATNLEDSVPARRGSAIIPDVILFELLSCHRWDARPGRAGMRR